MNTTQLRIDSPPSEPRAQVPAVGNQNADQEHRTPLVSIGLNCYKAERWIGECLNSLLAQTLQDFEIVVSDNASPDGTFDVCRAYAARDHRIRVYRTDRNVGVAGNLNRVFEYSRGEFFCWAAANDYYAPQFLERCVGRLLEEPGIDLVASQLANFETDLEAAEFDLKQFHGTMDSGVDRVVALLKSVRDGRVFRGVYRRQAILPLMPLSSRFGQDIMLVIGVAANAKLVMLDEKPYYYARSAPGTITHKIPAHLRVSYYEPDDGLRAFLFYRCRNQFAIWRIALRAATTGRERLRAAVGMLGVSYRWKSDLYHDLYDIAGMVRGYLRARREPT